MSLITHTAKNWTGGGVPLSAANLQTMSDSLEATARLAGSIPQTSKGLIARTHPDADKRLTQLLLEHADHLIMDDGEIIGPWDNLAADVTVNGAGGLDVGSISANTWYEFHAIRKPDGTQNVLINLATCWDDEINQITGVFVEDIGGQSSNQKIAQSFTIPTDGPVRLVDLNLSRDGTPQDFLKCTIQTDASTAPSGTILQTAENMNCDGFGIRQPQDRSSRKRFIFRGTLPTLTASTLYWIVFERTGTLDNTNKPSARAATDAYANGEFKRFDGSTWNGTGRDLNISALVETPSSPIMPSGFTQKCFLGWFRGLLSTDFKRMVYYDRNFSLGSSANFIFYTNLSPETQGSNVRTRIPPAAMQLEFRMGSNNTSGTTVVASAGPPYGYGVAKPKVHEFGGSQFLNFSNQGANVQDGGNIVIDYQFLYTALNSALGGVGPLTFSVSYGRWFKKR